MTNKTYKVGDTMYDIPEGEIASFLKDFPNAIETESFIIDKDTFDIPLSERDLFLKDNPTAKPVKKKEFSIQDAFTSASGKEELPFLGQSGQNLVNPQESSTPPLPSESTETPPQPIMEEPPKAKTVGEWVLGGVKAFDKSLADLAGALDYVHTSASDALNQIILGKETAVGIKKMREEETLVPTLNPIRPFQAIENLINYAHSGAKSLSENVGGQIVSGIAGVLPTIGASLFAPETLLPSIFKKAGLQVGSKFGMVMGAESAIRGAQDSEQGTILQKVEAPILGAIEGYMTGWMFDGIGAESAKIGERIANKLMPKVTTQGQAINKALIQQGGSMLANANIFGGYGVLDEYLRTGKISAETYATNAGMGIGLGLRDPARLLYAKGLNAFIATPKEVINRMVNSPIQTEEYAKKAQDKINEIEKGDSPNREGDLAAAKLNANLAGLNAIVDEIRDNKDEVIKSIKDSELEPKAKDLIIDKINEVDADNDPKVQATKDVNEKIAKIDEQLEAIRQNKSWDETRKEVESTPLKEKKLALKEEAMTILNKPIEGELKLGDKTFKDKKELTNWLDKNYNENDRFSSVNEDGYLESNTMKVFSEWYKKNKGRLAKEEMDRIDKERTKKEEEIKDAKGTGTKITEGGEQPQGMEQGEEGGLRVRDNAENGVEAVTGEEVKPRQIGEEMAREKLPIESTEKPLVEKPPQEPTIVEEPPVEVKTTPVKEETTSESTNVPPEPPAVTTTPETGGIKYGNKLYQSVEQIQEDYDSFSDFKEYNKVLEQVRSFEDGLRTVAKKKSKELGKKINKTADDVEERIIITPKQWVDDFKIKFFPINISEANTALWKQLVKVRDGVSDWVAGKLQGGMKSQADGLRWVSKTVTNWFGGLGRTESDILGKLKMTGTSKEFAPYEAKEVSKKLLALVNSDAESLRRVRDVLDPEIATEKLTFDDLSSPEQNLYTALRDLNEWIHETNYANGFISTETYLKFKNEDGSVSYLGRLYDKYESLPSELDDFIKRGNNARGYKLNSGIYEARKEVDEWKKEHAITDPVYITAKRLMQTIQNGAIKDYMTQIINEHPDFVKDVKKGEEVPDGYTKLSSSNRWGDFKNKAVIDHIVEDFTGFFYANDALNTLYDGMKMFDRNKLNQFYKKYRTVYNPFVQLGNFTGNMFFSSIAGINPVVLVSKMPEAKRLATTNPTLYKEILKSGILGASGITGDMTPITQQNAPIIKNTTKSQKILESAVKILGEVDDAAVKLYQGADNIAKIASYLVFKEQGLTHQQAVRRTYDSFQNYATVGKTWDVASKIPLVGNKFIKFQADLQRILVNSATMSPITLAGTLMLISAAATMASRLSGEDNEEKEVRENRKGVAKIPIVNIPLSFKFGKKEINVARYLSPLYLYRYGDADADIAELSKFLPIQFQKYQKAQLGETGNLPSFSDPALGWIGALAFDRDFRGVSIQNPQASAYFNPNITTEERIANVVNYVGRSQVPFYKSTQDIIDGIEGRLDYYGRKRSWSDAILNNLIKIQEFDKPELKSYMEGNIGYLTNRFTSLSERMGNSNSAFLREVNKAKEQKLPDDVVEKIYKEQNEIRSKRLQKSLDEQVPVMQELERLVGVYKKWNPDDPFVQENFTNIESGKNRRFDVLDDIDLQKKYKVEYGLLKNNGLLKKPDVPTYWDEKPLTDKQKKEYTSTYWSEYIRNIDMYIGLSQEEFDDYGGIIVSEKGSTRKPYKDKYSLLQELASKAAQEAKKIADIELGIY